MKKYIDRFLNWYVATFFNDIEVSRIPEEDPRRANIDRFQRRVTCQWNDLNAGWRLLSMLFIFFMMIIALIGTFFISAILIAIMTKTGPIGPTIILILGGMLLFAFKYKTG